MLICQEDNSGYEGNTDLAFFIDECSMGDPLSEFGKWFQSRFCGSPSMGDQLIGINPRDHIFSVITKADVFGVKAALEDMACHPNLKKQELLNCLTTHIGKHVSTENW